MSEPYLALTHHLLSRADEFAAIYNKALADYRIKHRLRTAAKPMPDLRVSPDGIEAAFWLDDLKTGVRSRAVVERVAEGWSLNINGQRFVLRMDIDGWKAARELKKFLDERRVRLSPLTLTLFTRLLVMDQFVHGIGGGRYDQVTDQVIEKFIGVPAPAFAVTTATLLFPTAVGRMRPCLPCLAHEGHRLRHALLSGMRRRSGSRRSIRCRDGRASGSWHSARCTRRFPPLCSPAPCQGSALAGECQRSESSDGGGTSAV